MKTDAMWHSAEAIYDDFADRKFRTAINNDGEMQWSPGGRLKVT